MPLYSFEGRSPTVDPSAFIAPTATLIGDVHVEAGASVWFNTVLRADFAPIIVREGANVQDGSVLHAPPGIPADVGPGATIAHGCVIHGVHIGAEAVIANHCDGARRRGHRRAQPDRRALAGHRRHEDPRRGGGDRRAAKVRGPVAGTGAEMWVNTNPGAYRTWPVATWRACSRFPSSASSERELVCEIFAILQHLFAFVGELRIPE